MNWRDEIQTAAAALLFVVLVAGVVAGGLCWWRGC